MLVKERMSHPVKTISPDVPVQEALARMNKDHVRRYPVLDSHGKMVGIVSKDDLLNASPSKATSLSVWEVNYLLSKITVEKVMSKDVITIQEDTVLEEAARIMADNDIGGLPVMRDGKLVGFITESNLFQVFLEMLGARNSGIRCTVLVKEELGSLYQLSKAIYDAGGNFVAVCSFLAETSTEHVVTFKVNEIEMDDLVKAVEPVVEQILDIRHMNIL
ncbi:MAG: CBS domain-containing protein [Anaerolineaceae bacterium]|nr:CBS domain-containing protein [Anaerolineaceae bacterium]